MENTHNFIAPRINLMGFGAIKDLPTELLNCKLKKALVVTDQNLITNGHVALVETILKSLFIRYDIFSGVEKPNPTVGFVEEGLGCFKQWPRLGKPLAYDMIISVGGGSNHDCAKAIAAVATNGKTIIDYEGYKKFSKPMLPMIAINTTSGSGAEVSAACIITDEKRKIKMALVDPRLVPEISVNDPMFMMTMPREVTVSSGIDVVSHAIEGYVATETSPMTDHWALGAIRLVFEYLPRAYENGNDLEAREKMMFASVMAGMSFTGAGLGYVHAMAHQLGGFYNQAHGIYNAVLLPHVLEYNSVSVPEERLITIAAAMGEAVTDKAKAVKKIFERLKQLNKDIGIPNSLKKMGVDTEDIDALSKNALKDVCGLTNPRQGTMEEIRQIFLAAM